MADRDLERRAETSRRLKAARWLAGEVDFDHETKNGRPKPAVRPLSPKDLAARQPCVDNGITANMIGEIERLDRPVFPMELRVIAEALEIPASFFLNPTLSWPDEDVGPPAGGLRRELRGEPPTQEDRPSEDEDQDEGHQ